MHSRPSSPARQLRSAGYTLVEMLFVVSLMIVLFAVASTGAKKSWQSQELKASAIHLAHDLTLASQSAQKLNKPVVVRFYKYFADAIASDQEHFHAYQLLVPDTDTPLIATAQPALKPLFEVQTLEGTTLISESSRFTSLMTTPQKASPSTDPSLPIGSYEYISIEFRPDGSTNLSPDGDPPTITLIPARGADNMYELPKEYQTLVLHPESGSVSVY
ncbi:MAG: Verru Chthon cassette protein [Verrucomicrobiaceae bacterium]|nr:Verru Chthon cassette protein [Verrucomicrobiaceae bacterium]